MIEIPRALARQFRAVLCQSLPAGSPRGPDPVVVIRAGPDGLTLEARQEEAAVRFHADGPAAPAALALPLKALAGFEGRDGKPVTLDEVAPGKGRATWDEGGVPRGCEFNTAVPDSVPPFPETPRELSPQPPAFLAALAEAVRTVARDAARYAAVTRVLLRGQAGELVGTDGRHLLVQGGFALPWPEDLLVPALPAFAGKELPRQGPVAVGRTEGHVAVAVGAWTFLLTIDTEGRYPRFDQVIPRPSPSATRLHLDGQDAASLAATLPRLPGAESGGGHVTLDLGEAVAVRARAEEGGEAAEAVLPRSHATGPPVRVATDRRYLLRALQLGFSQIEVSGPGRPLVCRDDTRTYLWMPLEESAAVPHDPGAVRVAPSADPAGPGPAPPPPPNHLTPRRKRTMPAPPSPEPPRNGAAPSPPAVPGSGPPDRVSLSGLIAEAEAVRAALHDASARVGRLVAALKLQQRHTRALRAAVASLRELHPLDP